MNVLKDLEDALWDELNAATCLWDIEDHPLVLSRPKIRRLQAWLRRTHRHSVFEIGDEQIFI